jgi:hypothetical protein
MVDKSKFIGIVTDVIDEHSFIFRSDNNVKCQIGQVVGINISNDIYMLANIEKIDVDYFLTNSKEYFTSVASDNKLRELSKGIRSPKYSQLIKANFIGIYEYNENDKHFIESNFSINSYTPSIFQEVVSFDFECIETVYGLKQNTEGFFKLGTFLYPNYSDNNIFLDVNIATDTFNSHTLISGVTGSGKSRLTALIANQLALNGGHITIIDPHNEYVNFADTKKVKVSFFAKNPQLYKERNDIFKRTFSLTNDYLTPTVLAKLLPNLSEQQYDYLCKIFDDIIKSNSKNLSLKKVIDFTIQRFNQDYKEEGHLSEILINAQKYAKEDSNYLPFIKRYVWYLNKEWYTGKSKPAKAAVVFTLLKRLVDIFEEDVFANNSITPVWLDYNSLNSINIMNIVYDSNVNTRRFINTIIQCFFTPQINHRVLIVDEAHLLLNERREELGTATLLSRLLRESRKYNLSIIFITQNEEDVPEDIKSQFQNKFKFREDKDHTLRYLDNQTCMCAIYKGKLSFPMRVDNVKIID